MTTPHLDQWPASDRKYRRSELTTHLGSGDAVWQRVAEEVLLWRVKTESGFIVNTRGPVSPGDRVLVIARPFGLTVTEPVEVIAVVKEDARCGFSYRTLPGHPVDGEEAFVVHRHGDEVHLTIRSLTRAASQQPWKLLFPLLLTAQRIVQRRYLRALR